MVYDTAWKEYLSKESLTKGDELSKNKIMKNFKMFKSMSMCSLKSEADPAFESVRQEIFLNSCESNGDWGWEIEAEILSDNDYQKEYMKCNSDYDSGIFSKDHNDTKLLKENESKQNEAAEKFSITRIKSWYPLTDEFSLSSNKKQKSKNDNESSCNGTRLNLFSNRSKDDYCKTDLLPTLPKSMSSAFNNHSCSNYKQGSYSDSKLIMKKSFTHENESYHSYIDLFKDDKNFHIFEDGWVTLASEIERVGTFHKVLKKSKTIACSLFNYQ